MDKRRTYQELESELTMAQLRLEELEETIQAIKRNEVDALVVDGPEGQQVFTLQGADHPYRILMETMAEGALTMAADGTILYCNQRLGEMLRMPLNKIIGVSLHDFVVSQEDRSLESMLNGCQADGCTGEFSLKTADGARVPVSLSANLLTLNDAETFCVVIANLTEQKRIQAMLEGSRDILEKTVEQRTAELKASRDQLQNIIDNMTSIVYVFDLKQRFLLGNISLARLFHTTPKELIGKKRHDFMPSETAEWHEANDRKAIETGHAVEFEEYGPLKDGHPITWLTTKFPLRDSQGNIYALAGISVDISERKKASEELERQVRVRTMVLQRQTELLDIAHDAIIVRSLDNLILFWNNGAEQMYGYTKNEALGKDSRALLKTQFSGSLDDLVRIVIKEGRWEGELSRERKDGKKIYVLSRWAPQRNAEGDPIAIMEMDLDITQHKQLEEQLRQSQKMEAIGTLAGGIAHDFNNILAAILGFTEMAVDDAADGLSVDKGLQNIHKSTLRAKDLVKQILTFARKTSYDRAPISLSPLVKETVQFLRASIPANIQINLSITAASDTVLASPTEVQQILMNLATNAFLAMEETGGALDIILSDIDFIPHLSESVTDLMPGEYAQLTVKDTGSGMKPDIMRRVFEPFFTTRDLDAGTGMGLAVVYGIVTDLKGTITVESEPGVGSIFRVFLPTIKSKVKKARMQRTHIPTGTESILFVDDEDMLVEWAKAALERLGYRATALTDPAEALNLFASDPSSFDLVITDQAMPAITGIQLAGELIAIRPDIPIILCTGHSATVSPETAKEAGIKEFLMKPLARQELARAIRHALDETREKHSKNSISKQ